MGSDCPHPEMNKIRARHPVRVKSDTSKQRRRLIACPYPLEIPWPPRSRNTTILSTLGPPWGFHGPEGYDKTREKDVGKDTRSAVLASRPGPATQTCQLIRWLFAIERVL